jgi:anthraniloyl-CoA monooxygenase
LRVVAAVKDKMPVDMPLAVRISAHDWVGKAGITPNDAVTIAQAFKAIGVDIIDVSAGQTSAHAQPVYGRMFQTPFADRIRHEANIPTMAVGNIFEPDHVNSILMAGRADLVCLGRPHLANANWTNQAAIDLGDSLQEWPLPYLPGREQAYRLAERAEQMTIRA